MTYRRICICFTLSIATVSCISGPRSPASIARELYCNASSSIVQSMIQVLPRPGSNDILVLYRSRDTQHLYLLRDSHEKPQALTQGSVFDFSPCFSPDGNLLVFSREVNDNSAQLMLLNLATGQMEPLTSGDSYDWGARFSSDGNRLVYASIPPGKALHPNADLRLLSMNDRVSLPLTSGKGHDVNPAFLPGDGKIIFCRALRFENYSFMAAANWHFWDLWSITADGKQAIQLTTGEEYDAPDYDIAPDGKRIIYDVGSQWSEDLWEVSLDTPRKTRAILPNELIYHVRDEYDDLVSHLKSPRYTPDGRGLFFRMVSSSSSRDWSIAYEFHHLDFETGSAKQLTSLNLEILNGSVAAKGNVLYFLAAPFVASYAHPTKYSLWSLNTDTEDARCLLDDIQE